MGDFGLTIYELRFTSFLFRFFGALLPGRAGGYVCRLRWERVSDNVGS